jgi:hypothetical protein
MDNIISKNDFINMLPGQKRDVLKSLGLTNLLLMELYNEYFHPYKHIQQTNVSQALNGRNPQLLNFISDQIIKWQNMQQEERIQIIRRLTAKSSIIKRKKVA